MKKKKKTFLTVDDSLFELVKNVKSTARLLDNKAGLISDNFYHLGGASSLRWFLSLNRNKKNSEISKIIIDGCQSAEYAVPGCSSIFFYYLVNSDIKVKNYFRLSTKDILKNIKKQVTSNAYNIIESVVLNINPITHISIIDNNNNAKNVIELKNGYRSDLVVNKNFAKMIGSNNIVLNNVKILLIEGAVSNVSEINTFLTKANETQENWLLVCRSFPEDLVATLATNWIKRKLNIVPLQYGTSYNNVNALVDLVKITGGMSVNCQFGDIVSVAVMDNKRYGFADQVSIYKKNIVLNTNRNVDKHKKYLINKMINSEESLQAVYAERISNLANELCEIRINKKNWLIVDEIDWAIKYYTDGACHGYVKINGHCVPKNWHDVCVLTTKTVKTTLNSIGGLLLSD